MTKTVEDANKFFHELGGVHDAKLLRLEWSYVRRQLQLDVDDLCSSFYELPEYAGRVEGNFVMHDVVEVVLRSDPGSDRPKIYDVDVIRSAGHLIILRWQIAPGGSLEVTCGGITVTGSDLAKLPQLAIEQLS